MTRRDAPPTKTQVQALSLAARFGRILPAPGGYWLDSTASGAPNTASQYNGDWVGTLTVRACERRGWFKRSNEEKESWKDPRVITPEGREALKWATFVKEILK